MPNLVELSEEQNQKLKEFYENVSDVLLDSHDDYFLLRWLRARKWNTREAEKMFRKNLKTRIMWNIDNLNKWDPPRVLKEYLPYGMVGFDKEGSPIIVVPFYNFDIYGMLHCVTRFDFQRYVVKLLESFLEAGKENSKIYGPRALQLVVLFDVANFNLKQYAWRPAAEFVVSMIKQYEQNYPEILKMCYIINATKIFSVAFNFLKKFLDEYTMSKINVYNFHCEKWKEELFQYVDPNIMPKCFGGYYTEEGDDKCPKMIVWAGKIPKDMYVKLKSESDRNRCFVDTVIGKGNKLKLKFDVGERKTNDQNQILSWEFRTFDYDIKFGIYSIDQQTGDKHSEVDLGTVYSNEIDEIGYISTRPKTTYMVVFDNSNSYLRNKKLQYWVSLDDEIKFM